MALNRDDYCDECWLIVSSENEKPKEGTVNVTESTYLEKSQSDPLKNTASNSVVENNEKTTTVKVEEPVTVKSQDLSDSGDLKGITVITVKGATRDERTYDENEKLVRRIPSPKVSTTSTKNESGHKSSSSRINLETVNIPTREYPNEKPAKTVINFDISNDYKTKTVKSNYGKTINGRTLTQQPSKMSFPLSILPSESQYLFGAKPNDSDLCLECLVIEHHHSFEKNLLQNVYGSSEEPHQCNTISVQKRGLRKIMQICEDTACPRFNFWKIIDSAGAGWKVGDSSDGCFPPPADVGVASCFVTSSGLCSKEQLIDLTEAGLSPHIMDEIRPDIEVSEWFCGRGDSTSRYGFKVSLLDSKQLMMNVYGQCVDLEPPESSRWKKVSYTFRNYMPGVRYILFHHGGSGEFTKGCRGGGEGGTHPGSKMAGASVRAKLPRIPIR